MRIGQFLALLRGAPPKRHADVLNLYALTNDFRAAVRYCRFYGIRPPSWIDPAVAVLVEAEIAEQEALASHGEGTAEAAVRAARAAKAAKSAEVLAPGPISEVSLPDACVRMKKLAGDYLRAHHQKGLKKALMDRLIDHCD